MWSPSAVWIVNGASSALGVARSPIVRANWSANAFDVSSSTGIGTKSGSARRVALVKKAATHRLGDSVERSRGITAVGLEVESLQHIEHLTHDDAARTGRAHAEDLESFERRVNGGAELGLVGSQVGKRDKASLLGHVPCDQLSGLPVVEFIGTLDGDPVESAGQVGLDQSVAGLPWLVIGLLEYGDGLGEVAQAAGVIPRRWLDAALGRIEPTDD